MAPKRKRENTGNFVSEWFGYRLYPFVLPVDHLVSRIQSEICPFLSEIKGSPTMCVKVDNRSAAQSLRDGASTVPSRPRATGVCSINSPSDGKRKEWINCPYRILRSDLIEECTRRLFGIHSNQATLIVPAPRLTDKAIGEKIKAEIEKGTSVFVFFEQKIGGEISLPPTEGSPELSFDITLAHIAETDAGLDVDRYAIVELQTSDFHGSPGHAVSDLRKAIDLFSDSDDEFAASLQTHSAWLSNRVEGPNISNIFKRTFYQMMFKFQLVKDPNCAGCALILPQAVWDSWQRHLGNPDLKKGDQDVYELAKPPPNAQIPKSIGESDSGLANTDYSRTSYIYVVEPDLSSMMNPTPLVIRKIIATDAVAFSYYALERAPEVAVAKATATLMDSLRHRIATFWPGFGSNAESMLFGP